MQPFLKSVVEDLYKKFGNNLANIAIVFPNKRAGLFFNEYLSHLSTTPLWAPKYITISELFEELSTSTICDSIELISRLYNTYKKISGNNESLDNFYYWGELLIKDFDDIDKNMANVAQLLSNLQDLHKLSESFDYLSEQQISAIKEFFIHFNIEEKSTIKDRFTSFWEIMLPLYTQFKDELRNDNLAYEGMLYRNLIENSHQLNFNYTKYIFVGFNLLNRVEEELFSLLYEKGQVLFYWDFDITYTENSVYEAGRFISRNLKKYPNELKENIFDNLQKEKNITFISAATENIQARYLSTWITEHLGIKEEESAIVLCDEGELQPVLHSLPNSIKEINITMGYPLSHTPVFSFVKALLQLQLLGYDYSRNAFSLESVNNVLKHTYILNSSPTAQQLANEFNSKRKLFISTDEFAYEPILKDIFVHKRTNKELIEYIKETIITIAKIAKEGEQKESNRLHYQLFNEALFKCYNQINRFADLVERGILPIEKQMLGSLITRVLGSLSVPFHGEPAIGLQIMGLLETRNLDFKNLILLSTNEGNLPRKGQYNSFIPHNLRKAFGLTLIEQRDSIYAYYFYRLLQRAENITLMYNSSENGLRQGEPSRYMLQIQANNRSNINYKYINAKQSQSTQKTYNIEKESVVMNKLHTLFNHKNNNKPLELSASAINKYLDCPIKFYYYYIAELRKEQEADSSLQPSDFGTIFHSAAKLFYDSVTTNNSTISKSQLNTYIEKPALLYEFVDRAFKECFFKYDEIGKLSYDGEQYINREVLHRFLLRLIKMDSAYTPFTYIGGEKKLLMTINLKVAGEEIIVKIGGRADRIDEKDNCIEIIDYKTGGQGVSIKNIEELFVPQAKREGYILQALLYTAANIYTTSKRTIPALVYIQKSEEAKREDTIIKINKEPITDFSLYMDEFLLHLKNTVSDIFDPSKPFTATEDKTQCLNCDFFTICRNGTL